MRDTIIKGTGNSRYLRFPPDVLSMHPDFGAFLAAAASEGIPCDLSGPVPAGCEVLGTALDKANLLSAESETSIWGAPVDQTVDRALRDMSVAVKSAMGTKKILYITVKTPDKIPVQGVTIGTLKDIYGAAAVTDADGSCVAVVDGSATVKLTHNYLDLQQSSVKISPGAVGVCTYVGIKIPYTAAAVNGTQINFTASRTFRVIREYEADVCCVGGGTGGTGGTGGNASNWDPPYVGNGRAGGAGGAHGKIKHAKTALVPGVLYEAVIGAGGAGGAGGKGGDHDGHKFIAAVPGSAGKAGGSTSIAGISSANGTDNALSALFSVAVPVNVNGSGGSTGKNGSRSATGNDKDYGTGGGGGPGGKSNTVSGSAGVTPEKKDYYGGDGGAGANGTTGNGGGGGGGGGGAGEGGPHEGSDESYWTIASGGDGGKGGKGGPGIAMLRLTLKTSDQEEG